MSSLKVGTVEEASESGGGGGPFTLETDWTIGSLPTDWHESWVDDFLGTPGVYSGTGVYTSDNTVDGGSYWKYDASAVADYIEATFMIAYNVTAWSSTDNNFGINGVPSNSIVLQYFPTASTLDEHNANINPGFDSITTDAQTGLIVISCTMSAAGEFKFYRHSTGVAAFARTTSFSAPGTSNPVHFTIGTAAYDFINDVSGTAGDVRVARTYVGLNQVLSAGAITAKATAWGWV